MLARRGFWALLAIVGGIGSPAAKEHLRPARAAALPLPEVEKTSIGGVLFKCGRALSRTEPVGASF